MRRRPLTGTAPFLCCLNNKQHLIKFPLFRISKTLLDPFCSQALVILVLFFQIFSIIEFTKPNSRHNSVFLFSISPINLTRSLTLITSFVYGCIHVINLLVSCYLQDWKNKGKLYAQSEWQSLYPGSLSGIYPAT